MPWCWSTSSSSSLFNSSFFSASNFLQTSLPLLTLIAHQQLFNGLLCLLLHLSSNFPTSFSPNFSHSINDHVDKNWLPKKIKPLHSIPPHLLLGVHFSSPPPTCQIFSCLSRSIRPQIVIHLFYLVSLTHTSISNLKSYTCMKLPSIN